MEVEKKLETEFESDVNEIEIMGFTIGGELFGIQVNQVWEIMMPSPVTQMPLSNPSVEGVFKPRDIVITVINLPKCLNIVEENTTVQNLFIVTNFKKRLSAFRVHTVVGIDRIPKSAIQKTDKTIYGGGEGVVIGLAQWNDRLITILDFEKIVAEIELETEFDIKE